MSVRNLQHVGLEVPDMETVSFPPKTGPLFLETEGRMRWLGNVIQTRTY